jgi:hypothetical protein
MIINIFSQLSVAANLGRAWEQNKVERLVFIYFFGIRLKMVG